MHDAQNSSSFVHMMINLQNDYNCITQLCSTGHHVAQPPAGGKPGQSPNVKPCNVRRPRPGKEARVFQTSNPEPSEEVLLYSAKCTDEPNVSSVSGSRQVLKREKGTTQHNDKPCP
jgi:hypothetical protein